MILPLRYALSALFLYSVITVPAGAKSRDEIINEAPAGDWRKLDPDNTLLMSVGGHGVIIALAPRFAPEHVANIRTLAKDHYFDDLAIVRVQDNFVTQWGDPDGEDKAKARSLGNAKQHLPAEFATTYKSLPLNKLADKDGWAPVTGFVDAFPVAADPAQDKAWIPHCYGVVGAGRNMAPDSSTGAELYAIIGQAPRGLDLNITVVGKVLIGMQYLAALPRGTAALGFYDKPEQRTKIDSVRLFSDLPKEDRPNLEMLRTDSKTWKALVEWTRNRSDQFYTHKANFTNVCNLTVPVREVKK